MDAKDTPPLLTAEMAHELHGLFEPRLNDSRMLILWASERHGAKEALRALASGRTVAVVAPTKEPK